MFRQVDSRMGLKIFVYLILLMILSGCSDNSPIKVGFVGSITGRHSELGVTARNTLQLLTEEKNAVGGIDGRPIELVVRDDKSSPAEAKTAITSLIDDGVQLILGPITSTMAEVTTEAIAGRNVLVMSPTMSTDFLAEKDDKLLRTATSSTGQANSLTERILSLGLRKTIVVYDTDNKKYTESIVRRFKKLMGEAGVSMPEPIAYSSSNKPDFNVLAHRIASSGADSVVFATNGFDGAMLAQSLRKLGADSMLFFGVSWTQSNDVIIHGGKAVEGMRFIALYDYGEVDPAIGALNKRYVERYHKEPSFIYVRYAGIFDIAVYALEQAYGSDAEKMKKAVLDKKEFSVVGREVVFNRFGDVEEQYNIVIVKDGEFVNDN